MYDTFMELFELKFKCIMSIHLTHVVQIRIESLNVNEITYDLFSATRTKSVITMVVFNEEQIKLLLCIRLS